ncbi:MAG: cellulose-binding protein [Polyangiaceae bacterium]
MKKSISVAVPACVNLACVLVTATSLAQSTATPSTVTVNTTSALAQLADIPIGANAAVYDSHLYEAAMPALLSDAGVRLVRYPGGSTADVYHWQSDTGSYAANTFDSYMSIVQAAHAQAIITVNYGSGTPAEAAGWVQYANTGGPSYNGPVPTYPGGSATGQLYHIKYWEIGNEIYGNSTYGGNWENDVNPPGPAEYAGLLQQYSAAMKAVDPSIKIGAVLTAPGNWPDGVTNTTSPQPWNNTVLSTACSAADFVIVHWYPQSPGAESDPGLLATPESGGSNTPSIASMVDTLQSLIAQYCGPHAKDIEILVTETNSVSYNPGKQTTSLVNGLFLADSIMTWLENGVTSVDLWAIHNGPTCGTNDSSSLYGTYGYGDYGFLSSGGLCSTSIEPPAETPFPSYYGVQMVARAVEPRGTLLSATSAAALVSAHAVQGEAGNVNVLLVNKDPATSYAVTVSLQGGRRWGVGDVFTYGENSASIAQSTTRVSSSSFAITLAPYSLTTVRVH